MSWLSIAFFAYFLSAAVVALDKFILAKKLPHPAVYAFYIGVIEIFALALLPFGFSWPRAPVFLIAFFSGVVFIAALVFLFQAIARFEASKVMPVVGALTPLALFTLSFARDDFALSYFQIIALIFLVAGSLLISYRKINRAEFFAILKWSVPAAFFFGLSYFLAKMAYNETNFISGFVIGRLGGFFAAILLFVHPTVRASIKSATAEAHRQSLFIIGVTRVIASISFIMAQYATFLGNATMVQALGGVQYIFLIPVMGVLSWKFPAIFQEDIRARALFRKIIATALILIGGFILLFSGKPATLATGVEFFGATFSKKYALEMGLDWRVAYLAVLDDLKIKHLRLPAYWDEIESQSGQFDFQDLDWQMSEAEDRGVKTVFSLGYRLPRWPECHIPKWASALARDDFERSALRYIETTMRHYQNNRAIAYWQVENEPFLRGFGECPAFSSEFLDKEIALVRSLDPRPIIVSDSGELSFWFQASKRADVFGTTMYRTIWSKYVGYLTYPLPPEFFHFKANIVRSFGTMRKAIVIELQAEPWGSKMAYDLSPDEEIHSFSPEKFRANIEYAKKVAFPEVYLWGAEWWYFKKQKGDSRYWDIAREIFNEKK